MADLQRKRADIFAVAKAAGVSPSTVSRSFNHPDLVKPATRRRIDSAVRRLGYVRNRAAQTIHGIRSGTIGLIVPTIDHAIFAELVQSFSDTVESFGFTILLASHGYSLDREYALTRKMLEHRVDGVALIGMEHSDDTYRLLEQQDMPTLLLWNHSESAPHPCVGSDNYQAGCLIGDHVVRLGHRAIAVVFPPLSGNDRASQRIAGVRDTLYRSGLSIAEQWRLETPYSVSAAKEAVKGLLQVTDRPSAIICGNDVLAWGALHALNKVGLVAPRDITVTGIGDFRGSKDFEPSLTTVQIPARRIGTRGAEVIIEAITCKGRNSGGELLPPKLVVRSTSGRLCRGTK